MLLHSVSGEDGDWCSGSFNTVEETRIAISDYEAMAEIIRAGLRFDADASQLEQAQAVFEDFLAKMFQDEEHERILEESRW